METAEKLEFQVGLAEGESSRRRGTNGLVEVRLGRVLDVFLKFRFHPRGTGKVLNVFKEVTLWGVGGKCQQCRRWLEVPEGK